MNYLSEVKPILKELQKMSDWKLVIIGIFILFSIALWRGLPVYLGNQNQIETKRMQLEDKTKTIKQERMSMTEKTKTEEKDENIITLEIGEEEIRFIRHHKAYEIFLNGMGKGKLTSSSNNFLISTVLDNDHTKLRALLKRNPSAAIQIAGMLGDVVAPELEIRVKN